MLADVFEDLKSVLVLVLPLGQLRGSVSLIDVDPLVEDEVGIAAALIQHSVLGCLGGRLLIKLMVVLFLLATEALFLQI